MARTVNLRTREGQLRFIELNLGAISECAHKSFEQHGRGALVVLVEKHDEERAQVPYAYAPLSGLPQVIEDFEGSKEEQLVRGYDPTCEMVIVFGWRQGGLRTRFSSYRIRRV